MYLKRFCHRQQWCKSNYWHYVIPKLIYWKYLKSDLKRSKFIFFNLMLDSMWSPTSCDSKARILKIPSDLKLKIFQLFFTAWQHNQHKNILFFVSYLKYFAVSNSDVRKVHILKILKAKKLWKLLAKVETKKKKKKLSCGIININLF